MGVVLDVDGVLQRGHAAVPGAPEALARLREHRVPHVFVTNNGGRLECQKAEQLNEVLGVGAARPEQVCLAHSPMRELAGRYKNVLILGCIDYVDVASEYGFENFWTVADVVVATPALWHFFGADAAHERMVATADASVPAAPRGVAMPDGGFDAVVQLTDCVDWGVELQVTLDVLRGGAGDALGSGTSQVVPFYSSNADFVFQGQHGAPRLAGAAFIECLDALLLRSTGERLKTKFYGKPFRSTYAWAERMLDEEADRLGVARPEQYLGVGDNPAADIRGANDAGESWRSALVKTGVWGGWKEGEANDGTDAADEVHDDVVSVVAEVLRASHEHV